MGLPLAKAGPDELACFLTVRNRLFTVITSTLAAAEAEHRPWPLRRAGVLGLDQPQRARLRVRASRGAGADRDGALVRGLPAQAVPTAGLDVGLTLEFGAAADVPLVVGVSVSMPLPVDVRVTLGVGLPVGVDLAPGVGLPVGVGFPVGLGLPVGAGLPVGVALRLGVGVALGVGGLEEAADRRSWPGA